MVSLRNRWREQQPSGSGGRANGQCRLIVDAAPDHAVPASTALARLWQMAQLPDAALSNARLTGREPVLPSSFAVSTAAQAWLSGLASLFASRPRSP